MGYITPHFVRYGLRCTSHRRQVVRCSDQEEIIVFNYPNKYKLVFESVLLYEGISIGGEGRSCTFVQTRNIGADRDEILIKLLTPRTGDYSLLLMGLDISNSTKRPHMFHLCTFKVHCESSVPRELFVSNAKHRFQWGSGADTILGGLANSSQSEGIIICQNPSLHIYFQLVDMDSRACFISELINNSSKEFSGYVFQWTENGQIHFLISCPESEKFIFNILHTFSNAKDKRSICSYLVQFLCYPSGIRVPYNVTDGVLGVTRDAKQHGIGYDQLPPIPQYVQVNESGEFNFELSYATLPFKTCYVELRILGHSNIDMTQYTHVYCNEIAVCGAIILPRIGSYILSFYTLLTDGISKINCNFYNTLIEASIPSASWAPFPTKSQDVPIGTTFNLISPKSAFVRAKTEVQFQVKMTGIHDMAVVSSSGWFHLYRNDHDEWTGTIKSGVKGTELKLGVRFESGSGDFTTICKYKVIDLGILYFKTIKYR